MDVQSALEISKRVAGIIRRAHTFGHDRTRLIEELQYLLEDYQKTAERLEQAMLEAA